MEHIPWLRKEIAAWQSEGLISEETCAKLLARYPQETTSRSWGIILAGSIGALLIGLGIIALFAANWDSLGRPARAAIAIAPVILCGIGALVATLKEHKNRVFWEALGILWCLAITAATCLVAQTYQVGTNIPGLILLIALLCLTVIWGTGAVIPMVLWPIFVQAWLLAAHEEAHDPRGLWLTIRALLFFCAGIPAYIAYLRNRPPRPAFLTAQFFSGVSFVCVLGFILAYAMDFHWRRWGVESCVLAYWFSALLLALSAWKWSLPVWRIVATLTAASIALVTPFHDLCDLWLFVLAFLLALGIIAYGIQRLRLIYMNIGVCLLLWHILVKFLSSDLDFTIKGLVMLSSGIALTTANVLFVRYRNHIKEENHEQEA